MARKWHVHVNRVTEMAEINIEAKDGADAARKALAVAKEGDAEFSKPDYEYLVQWYDAVEEEEETKDVKSKAADKPKKDSGSAGESSKGTKKTK